MDDLWDEEADLASTYSTKPSNYNPAQDRFKNETSFRSGARQRDGANRNFRQPDSFRGDRRNFNSSYAESSEILIDNSFVGKVIGKGGSKIKELQKESGAYIRVLKNETGAADTGVRISGSSEAQKKARNMIEDLISGMSYLSVQDNRDRNLQSSFHDSKPVEEDTPFDWAGLLKQSEEAKKAKIAKLPRIVKNFYSETPESLSMTPAEVKKFRKEHNAISVMKVDKDDDRSIPNPVATFEQAFWPYPDLLVELDKQGFLTPSPIQCQAWPILLQGYDMIGIAQTGTGKTIAFLFPALIHLVGQPTPREKRVGPSVLVLAPTRELAQQIEMEAKKYNYEGIRSICIYGGGNRRNQINNVIGVDVVIATPGRLWDLISNEKINVCGVTYLVLDEADRMLDMGFEPQIRKIVLDIREDRQTVMTSATWNIAIEELAARYMKKPFKVNVGAFDLAAVHTVTQEIVFSEDDYDARRQLLDDFIKNMGPNDKAIVFVDKKAIADDISSDLNLRGTQVQSIHGDREQYDREQALDDLKTGYVKILIATDVASRGLDIKDITLILNLWFPRNIEEYVHRVGRTGRAGRTGKAITVITRNDWHQAAELIKILEEADQEVPEELHDMAGRYAAWKEKKLAEDRAVGSGRRFARGGRNRF